MYVLGEFEVQWVENEGEPRPTMEVEIKGLRTVKGPRPKGPVEIAGCDPDILRGAKAGTTTARLGVGCALVVEDVSRLYWGDNPRLINNLRHKMPMLFNEEEEVSFRRGIVGLWRDGAASGTCWCADVCAGVAESTDLWTEAVREAVEIGFYREDGRPARLCFKDDEAQDRTVRYETRLEWERIIGGSLASYHWPEIPCKITGVNYSTEPESGSVEMIYQVSVDLPEIAGGWRMRDTEHMQVKGKYVPLDRHPVLIAIPPPPEVCPVLISFGREGIDPHGVVAKVYPPEDPFANDLVNGKMWRSVEVTSIEVIVDYIHGI